MLSSSVRSTSHQALQIRTRRVEHNLQCLISPPLYAKYTSIHIPCAFGASAQYPPHPSRELARARGFACLPRSSSSQRKTPPNDAHPIRPPAQHGVRPCYEAFKAKTHRVLFQFCRYRMLMSMPSMVLISCSPCPRPNACPFVFLWSQIPRPCTQEFRLAPAEGIYMHGHDIIPAFLDPDIRITRKGCVTNHTHPTQSRTTRKQTSKPPHSVRHTTNCSPGTVRPVSLTDVSTTGAYKRSIWTTITAPNFCKKEPFIRFESMPLLFIFGFLSGQAKGFQAMTQADGRSSSRNRSIMPILHSRNTSGMVSSSSFSCVLLTFLQRRPHPHPLQMRHPINVPCTFTMYLAP